MIKFSHLSLIRCLFSTLKAKSILGEMRVRCNAIKQELESNIQRYKESVKHSRTVEKQIQVGYLTSSRCYSSCTVVFVRNARVDFPSVSFFWFYLLLAIYSDFRLRPALLVVDENHDKD